MLPVRTSRWFIYSSTSLLVFLCIAVTYAGLLLMRRGLQPRFGQVTGSSMEPSLPGPRALVPCFQCGYINAFAMDTFDQRRLTLCVQCESALPKLDEFEVAQGGTIKYLPLQLAHRLKGRFNPHESGLSRLVRRGDVVVLARKPNRDREIKRVVGLPSERIEIREGDIWVNDVRYEKQYDESLQQSVLVDSWSTNIDTTSLTDFLKSVPRPITNALSLNAHAPHAEVPVRDVGIGFRLLPDSKSWHVHVSLPNARDGRNNLKVELELSSKAFTVKSTGQEPVIQTRTLSQAPVWLLIFVSDGRLVVGNETSELGSISLDKVDDNEAPEDATERPGFAINKLDGELGIDRCLVFRDIQYRGLLDLEMAQFASEPGFIVLGDNVAISDDSRVMEKDSATARVPLEQIRGIVVQSENALESLLHQTRWTAD